MHTAPSVSYPVGRPLFAGVLCFALWLAGVIVTACWAAQADFPDWRQGVAGILLGAAGAWALVAWLHSPVGELKWDGAGWTAPGSSGAGVLEAALDLQQVLLVRWHAGGSARWLWLERRRNPYGWMDLRRAVYSRATPHAPLPARPPAVSP